MRYLEIDNEIYALKIQRDEICRKINKLEQEQEREKNRMIDDYLEHGLVPFTDSLIIKKVPPKVIITDESKIPERFFKSKKELNKIELNNAVKQSEAIDGVTMSNGGYTLARIK